METILLTGASGQLGKTFNLQFEHSSLKEKYTLLAFDKTDMDLTKEESTSSVLSMYRPSVIINCGAFTKVDDAEISKDEAFKGTSIAPGYIAKKADELNDKTDCNF